MKKLRRTYYGRIFGGVCSGIAKYLSQLESNADDDTPSLYEVDPTWIRLAWVFLTLMSVGLGVFIYAVCWIVMPEE